MQRNIELELTCPATKFIYLNPRELNCGHTIEEDYVKALKTCPCCRAPITNHKHNRLMSNLVEAYLKDVPEAKSRQYEAPTHAAAQASSVSTAPSIHEFDQPYANPSEAEIREQEAIFQTLQTRQQHTSLANSVAETASVTAAARRNHGMFNLRAQSDIQVIMPICAILTGKPIKPEETINVVLLGSSQMQRSEFAENLRQGSNFESVIGMDLIRFESNGLKFSIYDASGHERYTNLIAVFLKHAAIALCFDNLSALNRQFDPLRELPGYQVLALHYPHMNVRCLPIESFHEIPANTNVSLPGAVARALTQSLLVQLASPAAAATLEDVAGARPGLTRCNIS